MPYTRKRTIFRKKLKTCLEASSSFTWEWRKSTAAGETSDTRKTRDGKSDVRIKVLSSRWCTANIYNCSQDSSRVLICRCEKSSFPQYSVIHHHTYIYLFFKFGMDSTWPLGLSQETNFVPTMHFLDEQLKLPTWSCTFSFWPGLSKPHRTERLRSSRCEQL